MKTIKSIPALLVVMFLLSCAGAASEAKGQTYIDSMVRDNINLRRRAEVYKSRRSSPAAKKSRPNNRSKTSARRSSAATANSAEKSATVHFGMDSFNHYAEDDPNGFVVNFEFTRVSDGAILNKSHNYNAKRGSTNAILGGIPAGNYTVTAKCVYQGRARKVLLATEIGEPSNPNGGNFASSINIQVTLSSEGLKSSPSDVYIRIVD